MPLSLSFIPDGNRRWATAQDKTTLEGHTAGANKIKEIIEWLRINTSEVDECVFWCLSRSNLERNQKELDGIFFLLRHYFTTLRSNFMEHRIAFLALGETHLLPDDTREVIQQLEEDTRQFIKHKRLGF